MADQAAHVSCERREDFGLACGEVELRVPAFPLTT
jgi:hypothetical protein